MHVPIERGIIREDFSASKQAMEIFPSGRWNINGMVVACCR